VIVLGVLHSILDRLIFVSMNTCTEDEWTFLTPVTEPQLSMDTTTRGGTSKADAPVQDLPMDNVSDLNEDKDKNNDGYTSNKDAALHRKDSKDSINEEYCRPHRANRRPPTSPNYYPPPVPIYSPAPPIPFPFQYSRISSSTQLLEQFGKEDGVFELPYPLNGRVYLATYPFGDRDVQKWSWLFAAGIEDEYLVRDSEEYARPSRGTRNRYNARDEDMSSVYLSRALDVNVVPEDTKHSVRFFIVTGNPSRLSGFKLLVAESRKAASMLIYYEMLKGDSVLFVGAMVHECKTGRPKRYKKVNSLEEAVALYNKGAVGVIC
jgi:hypothetical protein